MKTPSPSPKPNDFCPCESGATFGTCHGQSPLDGPPDYSSALGALVARAIDLGFEIIRLERDPCGGPDARLLLGYARQPGAKVVPIDGARLTASREYFTEMIHELGRVGVTTCEFEFEFELLPDEAAPIEQVARRYIAAHAVVARAENLKATLLMRMMRDGRTAIEVPGAGAVVYAAGTTRTELDRAAAAELLKKFGAEPPMKKTKIAPSVRVTHAGG